ncbi:MAG: penicillin-binding protein 2, partial [Rhodobacteraceae bacterium]|nr:penicillin-binding protein 2 [Paracoccaceae bacterium]
MSEEIERLRRRQFTRRALALFGAQTTIAGALGWRMYQLQVLESDAYAIQAEENRINQRPVAPIRGEIFDRNGAALAVNRHNYRVRLIREQMADLEETITRLRQLIEISPRELDRALRKIGRQRDFVPVMLKENLTWAEYARLNANAPALPGVVPEVSWVREYPAAHAEPVAHVIGYVSAVNQRDLDRDPRDDPSLKLPGARIGKNGVEKAAEAALRGIPGHRRYEVNAAGREIREIERDEGLRGADLELTIDTALQDYAMRRLEGESAAVVVMDVWTGDLLAMASAPAYDPNKFVFGISQTDWSALRDDDHDPLRNKAVAGAYPPGSTFKMLTALAAMEHGVMSTKEKVRCTGKTRLGRRDFHCWKRTGHGAMSMKNAIKKSCDVYFYEAAKRVGIDRLAAVATRYGIGQKFDLEIPNLASGVMPSSKWKLGRIGERWHGGETLIAGIGQGYVLASPLQLAVMAARIANGREQVAPRLIRAVNGEPVPTLVPPPLGSSAAHLRVVREGMDAVSNESGGTAYRSRIAAPNFQLAGKTGTAQVRRISRAEREKGVRKNEELPWRLRDHALFVAFAPVDKPRYAISVVVEHGGGGSKAAAPIARDVMMRALYGREPPLEAYPEWLRKEIEAEREAAQREAEGL